MSKLDDLIKKLCPDGVEYKELEEVLENNSAKSSIVKKNYKKNGKYPIIDQSRDYISGYTDEDDAVPGIIPCIIFGDHTRIVKYVDQKFAQGESGTKVYKIKDGTTNLKYVYYAFSNIEIKSRGYNRHWSIAKKIKIPIPPKEIQEEIVRILDSFTELGKELEKELEKRRAQYEFYRDSLLTFGDDVEWKELEGIVLKVPNIKWDLQMDGQKYKYIDLTSVDRVTKKILSTVGITKEDAPSRARQIVKKDDVIFATTRPLLQRYTFIDEDYDGQICSTGFCVLRADTKKVLPKWVYYNISFSNFYIYVGKNEQGASYPSISDLNVKKFKIPIPPLEEQERIVSILDKFDALCNDISIGLPAEIDKRRKQYEYYREKLLNFKNISENN